MIPAWQMERVFKGEEEMLLSVWQSYSSRKIHQSFLALRGHSQPAYVQATSLLKLTSAMSMEEESDEVMQRRAEVAGADAFHYSVV